MPAYWPDVAKAREGLRLGHAKLSDHMFLDGLEDAYGEATRGRAMGTFAEETARALELSRAAQDEFALASLERARRANEDGTFAEEIAPVSVARRGGDVAVTRDEQPFSASPEKIPLLKPAFAPDGTVTAANSSSISDGAAALVLMTQAEAFTDEAELAWRELYGLVAAVMMRGGTQRAVPQSA